MFSSSSPKFSILHRWWLLVLVVGLAGLFAACGSNATPASNPEADALLAKIASLKSTDGQLPGTYIGTVANSEFYIAIVVEGNTAVGYLCDGKVDAWLKGRVEGDQVTLTSADGATLTGTLANNTLTGKVTPAGGSALDFSAPVQQGDERLFRLKVSSTDVDYVGGWIIREDGTRGLLRRIFGGGGSSGGPGPGEAIPVNPDCDDVQDQYNTAVGLLKPNLSAKDRAKIMDTITLIMTDAIGQGCLLTPYEQP